MINSGAEFLDFWSHNSSPFFQSIQLQSGTNRKRKFTFFFSLFDCVFCIMEKFKIPLDSLGICLVIYATCDSLREQLCTFHFAKKKLQRDLISCPKYSFLTFLANVSTFSASLTHLYSVTIVESGTSRWCYLSWFIYNLGSSFLKHK